MERASRYERPLCVAFVDIDHFKAVNDSYGHASGDIVLRGVAQTIAENLRTSDLIGRYGGEEFMLILTETNVEEGAELSEKLRVLVERCRFNVDGNENLSVTISIGIVGGAASSSGWNPRARRRRRDVQAKSLGRNQTYVFAEPDDDARVPRAPISTAGRNRAQEIGRAARDAAQAALTSYIAPLPHYRGQPSALIATIVVELAGRLGLPDTEVDKIRVAALLHDVGKVGIPEDILEKPSALTSAEWRTVVQHPRIGQVILEQASALRDAVPIILHHHERFSGHGYPYGLRGTDIPIGARIVAIADAYDAMTHDRPYKRAMTHDDAVKELRRHAGTQFDPELVTLFCDLFAAAAPAPDRPSGDERDGPGSAPDALAGQSAGPTRRARAASRRRTPDVGAVPVTPWSTAASPLSGVGRGPIVRFPGVSAGPSKAPPDGPSKSPCISREVAVDCPSSHAGRLVRPARHQPPSSTAPTAVDHPRSAARPDGPTAGPPFLPTRRWSLPSPLLPSVDPRRRRGRPGSPSADREGEHGLVNKVLSRRLTRDPEMRSLASGKNVTTFTVASNEFVGGGKEKSEYHPIVAWDRLAEIAGRYLGKGQQVAIEGRLQTRSWDDEKGARHWKTEIVASHVEMLSGRRKKDYEAQQAADSAGRPGRRAR